MTWKVKQANRTDKILSSKTFTGESVGPLTKPSQDTLTHQDKGFGPGAGKGVFRNRIRSRPT